MEPEATEPGRERKKCSFWREFKASRLVRGCDVRCHIAVWVDATFGMCYVGRKGLRVGAGYAESLGDGEGIGGKGRGGTGGPPLRQSVQT